MIMNIFYIVLARSFHLTHINQERENIMSIAFKGHSLPGKLIAVCGIDGVGKTTQIDLLIHYLQNKEKQVLRTMQPTAATREHPLFKRYLFHPEERDQIDYRALLCIMMSDRLQHIHEVILPALANNQIVVTDRYIFTMLATMWARGYQNESWVYEACQHILLPDLTLLLNVPLELAINRIRERTNWRDSYVEKQHLEKTHAAFLHFAEECDLDVIDTSSSDPLVAFTHIQNLVDGLF